MDFKNKKVVIMGLGSYKDGSGISAALYFLRNGAKLLITDLKKRKELETQLKRLKRYKDVGYVLGKHRKKDFENADLIFKNPSVPKDSPYLKIARHHKIPIINDWTIYFKERLFGSAQGKPNNILIGITGTKGKSTTATLIYKILKAAHKDVVLCGNIGQSPLAILEKIKKNTIVVAELSSWALQEFEKSPQISVITNLMPEHLDKYKNLNEYYKDKENIFRFQEKDDYLIVNKNDEEIRKRVEKLARRSLGEGGAKSKKIWFDPGKKYDAARKAAEILNIPQKITDRTIKNFRGIPGRLEFIASQKGVKYINDTTATMPDAAIFALHSIKKYKGRIILIAGGVDKKLDYKNLAKEIPKYCKALILFEGRASDKIIENFPPKADQPLAEKLKIISCIGSMEQAVTAAEQYATRGDIILLSPGAASFNLFKNEFDRGAQFVKFVKCL